MTKEPLWIAGIARGHNAGVCLLKNGEIVFSIEEERLTRRKYDGGPLASILKIKEYTDKVDYLVVAHTQSLDAASGKLEYSQDNIYTGLARKLGLIKDQGFPGEHPQVVDMWQFHHKMHAGLAFYRSGFDEAVAVVIDGAGTFFNMIINDEDTIAFETESIYKCNYPATIKTLHKTIGARTALPGSFIKDWDSGSWENNAKFDLLFNDRAGIVKVYEAVTEYCGFSAIEAGKTMGLFPYGKDNKKIPKLFEKSNSLPLPLSNRNVIVPRYPNGAVVNAQFYDELLTTPTDDVTTLNNRRDLAYSVQTQTQQAAVEYIRYAVKKSGCKNVVLSGGYGLNCVANYFYLDQLKDEGINLYVEPISNDAGTAMGAALIWHHNITQEETVRQRADTVYLGPKYDLTTNDLERVVEKYNGIMKDATDLDVVNLMRSKNIVAMFQGCSENGPRALGNRSLMFDPTFEDGKDWVNRIKHREYFRPFAGSILEEDAHDWFDLRGMENSPTMMYAVNCQPGIAEKIPSIIHVDGTCRIQTVTEKQNPLYYRLIKKFKEETNVPIIFNTSFNLGGEPLVETFEDACRTLANSDIEYLYLPEYSKLITIQN